MGEDKESKKTKEVLKKRPPLRRDVKKEPSTKRDLDAGEDLERRSNE